MSDIESDKQGDKRRFNKGVIKYDEPKDCRVAFRLTQVGYDWLYNAECGLAGADVIEWLARGWAKVDSDKTINKLID